MTSFFVRCASTDPPALCGVPAPASQGGGLQVACRACPPGGRLCPPKSRGAPTCDTLHAHTQVLGKLAVKLAPSEPQLQHAALRLTARGWETLPLGAPDGSGAIVVALDLHAHEAVVEHSAGGRRARCAHSRQTGRRGDARTAADGWDSSARSRSTRPHGRQRGRSARRGRRAPPYDPGASRSLLRGRDSGRARPRGASAALPWPLDAGQRLVGLVQPRRQPVLGLPADRPAAISSRATRGLPGGRRRLVAG